MRFEIMMSVLITILSPLSDLFNVFKLLCVCGFFFFFTLTVAFSYLFICCSQIFVFS